MTQAYQKSHYSDYDPVQQSERRSTQRPLLGIDRGVPYVPYSARPEARQESRNFVLPTPIHDLEQDSDQGSSRKRSSVACTRCRRRKIKCRGGPPCLNCRNAGVDASACNFHRVGTKHTFDLDTSVGGSTPMGPMSPYSPVSPPLVAYPTPYVADERPSAIPAYSRSGYSQPCLPCYNYETSETQAAATPYTMGEGVRSWSNTHRPGTTVGYYEPESTTAYDYPVALSRVPSNASEPLSPLNMSNLQSSLPPPIERRLPAPNLVGSLMTPETSDPRNPYTRNNGTAWSINHPNPLVSERRQPSIQDLADASMMLPSVTRGLSPAAIPATTQDSGPMTSELYGSSQTGDGLSSISTPSATTQQAYSSSLPSLSNGMLPPATYARYTNDDRTTPPTGYYSWAQPSTGTDTAPVIASIEVPQDNPTTTSSTVSASRQSRYPPLHHPRPKILPSSSHAAALEKYDRVYSKETQSSKGSQSQNKTSHSTTGSKKAAHKPGQGSL